MPFQELSNDCSPPDRRYLFECVMIAASAQTFIIDDIQRSLVLEFGAMYLLQSIAQQIGLLKALQSALPKVNQEMFTLARYLVTSGSPFLYCKEWLSRRTAPNNHGGRVSRLQDKLSKKYLIIRKSENTSSGYIVNIREEAVAKGLRTAGWLVVLSKDVSDSKQTLPIYRQKEEGTKREQNSFCLQRSNVGIWTGI